MTTNTNISTIMNNGVGFDFSNSMKLIRWDVIKALQPEKIEILTKWFEAVKVPYYKSSTPVIDMTTGIVYPTIALGNYTNSTKYKVVRKNIINAITENKPYNPSVSVHITKNGLKKGKKIISKLHSDYMGNEVIGHQFFSVSDVSMRVLEVLYNNFLDSGIKFDGVGEYYKSNKEANIEEKVKTDLNKINKVIAELEVKLESMRPGQWGIGEVRKDIKEAKKIKKDILNTTIQKNVIAEGKVKVTPELCQQIKEKLPFYLSPNVIQKVLELAVELSK